MNSRRLYRRLNDIFSKISEEDYPEIYNIIENELDFSDEEVYEEAYNIAGELHEADGTKILPACVADFIMEVYKEELKFGNVNAACDIGSLYYTGRAGEQNYKKAVEYYTIAANGGCRQAQENLGYCYYYGRDIPVDYEKAFHYFALGAFDGHLRSLYKIGDMYRNGYYVDKNEAEAFCIYMHCVDGLNEDNTNIVGGDIMMRIGDCFFNGTGTEVDNNQALKYYQLAEQMFYDRLESGDFLIKNCYKHVLENEEKARQRLIDALPGYEWTK